MHPQRLRLRRWAGEVVLYDDRSGDTHLLDDLAGRVLERLMGATAGERELLDLAASQEAPSQEHRAARVYDVLERLRRMGVAKPSLP